MHTVDSLMDEAKNRQGIKSDYKLAQVLGVTQNTVSNYRHGRSRPDDLMLTKLGELAEVDPEAVELLAVQLQVERAQNEDAKALWARLAARLQAGSVHVALMFVAAFLALLSHAPNAQAAVTDFSTSAGHQSVYYVKRLMQLLARARAFFRRSRHSTFDSMQRVVTSLHHVQSAHPAAAGLAAA